MGKSPISRLPGIKRWLGNQNKITLWDISSWDPVPPHRWIGWSLPDCPVEMDDEKNHLFEHLTGAAPLASKAKDKRGWGSKTGNFSLAQGYEVFVACPNVPNNPAIW